MALDNRDIGTVHVGDQTVSYDKDVTYSDGEDRRAIRGDQIRLDEAPTEDEDVVRKVDLATLTPTLDSPFLIAAAAAALTGARQLQVSSPLQKSDGGAGGNMTLSINGQSVSNYTFVVGIRWNGETLQMQTRALTFTNGVLTAISSAAWSTVPTV